MTCPLAIAMLHLSVRPEARVADVSNIAASVSAPSVPVRGVLYQHVCGAPHSLPRFALEVEEADPDGLEHALPKLQPLASILAKATPPVTCKIAQPEVPPGWLITLLRVAGAVVHLMVVGHLLWLALLQVVVHSTQDEVALPAAGQPAPTGAQAYTTPHWSSAGYFAYLCVPVAMLLLNRPLLRWLCAQLNVANIHQRWGNTPATLERFEAQTTHTIKSGFTQCLTLFALTTEACMYLCGLVILTPGLILTARDLPSTAFYGPNFVVYSVSFFVAPISIMRLMSSALMPRHPFCTYHDTAFVDGTYDKLVLGLIDISSMVSVALLPGLPRSISTAVVAFVTISLAFVLMALTQINLSADNARDPRHSLRMMHTYGMLMLDMPFLVLRCVAYAHNPNVGAALLFKNILSIVGSAWASYKYRDTRSWEQQQREAKEDRERFSKHYF